MSRCVASADLDAFDPKRTSCLLASNRCVAKFGVAKHILPRLKNGFVEPLPARRPFRAIGIQGGCKPGKARSRTPN
jgi:hypothetical protein